MKHLHVNVFTALREESNPAAFVSLSAYMSDWLYTDHIVSTACTPVNTRCVLSVGRGNSKLIMAMCALLELFYTVQYNMPIWRE